MTSSHFETQGFQAQIIDGRVELSQGADHVATVIFRPSGVYTIVERGRGDAGRLPAQYAGDIQAATEYVVRGFWPALPSRRAA